MTDSDNSNYSLEELILMGVVEASGIDAETGDMLYAFSESMLNEYPEINKRWQEAFHKELMFYWENGLIDMNVTSANPTIRITPKGVSEEGLSCLSINQKKMFIAFRELFKK
jgi:hypothetical protein